MPEQCAICRGEFAFADMVHLLIHTQSEEGILDRFVCRRCYQEEIAQSFASTDSTDADG